MKVQKAGEIFSAVQRRDPCIGVDGGNISVECILRLPDALQVLGATSGDLRMVHHAQGKVGHLIKSAQVDGEVSGMRG